MAQRQKSLDFAEAAAASFDAAGRQPTRTLQVAEEQRQQQLQQQQRRLLAENVAAACAAAGFSLRCRRCSALVTDSRRLRVAQGCHRLALDPQLLDGRLQLRKAAGVMAFVDYTTLGVGLLCRCGHKVANLCQFKQLVFPEILVQGVVFVREGDDTKIVSKKWKQTEKFLHVADICGEDLIEWAKVVPDIPDSLLQ